MGSALLTREHAAGQVDNSASLRVVGETAQSDEQLVALIVRGEDWALAELYDRYVRLVFSLAFQVLNDRASAEETVQEVFTKVWRGAHTFQSERGKFSSWLIGITHHHCLDALRRRRVRPVMGSTDDETMPQLAVEDDPVEAAEYAFERARVRSALLQIPDEQRFVIELAYFEGLTHYEIAARCGDPLGTVKTRLRLGMQKLKEMLKD
jgi:RNA polymerase sigma-70 factor (ECF subfamily)